MLGNPDARRLAQEIAGLRKDLDALARSTQLGRSSVESGAIKVYDDAGVLRHVIGEQADGTYAFTERNAPPPDMIPSAPQVVANTYAVFVTWDGTSEDGTPLLSDFAAVEVYADNTSGFTPSAANHVASIPSTRGSTVALPPGTGPWFRLTIRNTSDKESEPSDAVNA